VEVFLSHLLSFLAKNIIYPIRFNPVNESARLKKPHYKVWFRYNPGDFSFTK